MKTKDGILWKERFADRAASGLKVEDWCEKNGITKHAYYYWHRKVQDNQPGLMENRFVEVMVNDPLKEGWCS
ncbi:IS66 family insertion sequence element accessory protein TnpA [Lacrimispora xylanisolvens]|uniref:IS66 family insertion sequence element accessory protein TnpA n=1 Tax=Lacrimispora xylanisolvens TaxID=384636 RepID=UPI002402C3F1